MDHATRTPRVALGCAPTHTRERHFEFPIEPGTLGTLERWRRRRQQRRQRLRQGEQLGIQPGLPVARVYNCAYSPLRVRIFGSQVRRGARPPMDSGTIGTIGTSSAFCQTCLAHHKCARCEPEKKKSWHRVSCILSCQKSVVLLCCFNTVQQMEYAPFFASATTLHLPWTGKAPPGDPPASRIGRVGGASLYCTLGGSGGSEPASPQEKGVQPTGLASRR